MEEKIQKLKDQLILKAELEQNYNIIPFIKHLKPVAVSETIAYVQKGSPYIYVNWEKFLNEFTISECYGIINHEFLHIIYEHLEYDKRINNINHHIHNIAADIIINDYLLSNNFKLPDFALTRKSVEDNLNKTQLNSKNIKLNGKNSIEIYYELLALREKHDLPPMLSDLNINENLQGDSSGSLDDDAIVEELNDLIRASKHEYIGQEVEIVESKNNITLFDFLQTKIGNLIKRDLNRTYTRPNRRGNDLLPYNRKITLIPKISIFVDVSGSMDMKPYVIFGNLQKIHNKLKEYDVEYYSFNFDVRKLTSIKSVKIGGGTDIQKVINYPTDGQLKIIITDCSDKYDSSYNRSKTLIISNNKDLGDIITDSNFSKIIKIN